MKLTIHDCNDIEILSINLDEKSRLRTRVLKIVKRPLTLNEYSVIERTLKLLKDTCLKGE